MQHTDKAIAEFEAWWDRQPHREQFEDLKQQFCNVAVAFYQKGREGVVVHLPEERQEDGLLDKHDMQAAMAANQMLNECREAVKASGAKVKS